MSKNFRHFNWCSCCMMKEEGINILIHLFRIWIRKCPNSRWLYLLQINKWDISCFIFYQKRLLTCSWLMIRLFKLASTLIQLYYHLPASLCQLQISAWYCSRYYTDCARHMGCDVHVTFLNNKNVKTVYYEIYIRITHV